MVSPPNEYPGPVLRAWIELEVDAGINRALRQLAESDQAKSLGADGDWARQEVRAVAQSQARLLQLVGGISADVDILGEQFAKKEQEASGLAQAMEHLKSAFSVWRSELASELRLSGMRGRGGGINDRPQGGPVANAQLREDVEESLASMRTELASAVDDWNDVTGHLEQQHLELAELVRSWQPWLEKRLAAFQQHMAEEFCNGLRKHTGNLLEQDDQLWAADLSRSSKKRVGVGEEGFSRQI